MKRFGATVSGRRLPEHDSAFVKSTPVTLQSFAQFQASRAERLNEIASDLEAKKQRELQERQVHLQDLILQLTTAQLALTDGERDFLTRKESLVTDLHRIQSEAEVQFAQTQLDHINEKESIEREHDRQLQLLAESLPSLIAKHTQSEKPSEFFASRSKASDSKLRPPPDDLEEGDETDVMYSIRIRNLEDQKRELLQTIREDHHSAEERIVELTMMLEDEENERKAELEALHYKMEKQENTAKKTMNRLYTDLEAIQQKRQRVMQTQKAKVEELQRRIDSIDAEFNTKLKEATKTAETLKTRLLNANLRKNQHLEMERKRSSQQQKLLQDSYSLHQEVFDMQKKVNKAKEESGLLRRELSANVGPQRTASIFM
jgi:hypothetical protein